ncbi:MAG: hypothetical protein HKN42_12410 [Granulosicoccus sp.]|nr:hypothetical protein [Granulosicoccus sp.]
MNSSFAGINPYVGLRSFERETSVYFFGRRGQTAELLEQLHSNRFLAVLGRSGCGKSSLVRAGLIPALLGGFLVDDRDKWEIVVFKPGGSPLHNLAQALSQIDNGEGTDVAALERSIEQDQDEAVVDFLQERIGDDTNVLLLVDQFEEIFGFRGIQDDEKLARLGPALRQRQARRRAEAANFMDVLLALPENRDLPLYVSLTMRSDFLGDCDAFHGLPEAMNRSRYLVPRLTRSQLRETVQGPALLSGVPVTARLLDTVINDVGGQADQLPVLQHALLRTWNAWKVKGEGPLDLQHYESVGGLRRALSIHAEEALDEQDAELAKLIFQCLTDTDSDQRRIRRPATLSELVAVTGATAADIESVIDRFRADGRNFLLVSDSRGGDKRVDISHESLIRQWKKLRDWIDEEGASRDQYLDLVSRARGERALLRNPDLALAVDWLNTASPSAAWAERYSEREDDFSVAMNYLQASRAAEKEQAQKKKRFRLMLGGAAGAALVALAGLTVWALEGQQSARQAQARAESAESEAESLRAQAVSYASLVDEQIAAYDQAESQLSGVHIQNSTTTAPNVPMVPTPGQAESSSALEIPLSKIWEWANRRVVASNVSLNGQGNVIRIPPGEQFTISFTWSGSTTVTEKGKDFYCPSCIVQLYYGLGNTEGNGEPQCVVSDIMQPSWMRAGEVRGSLSSPSAAGTYFITLGYTLEYSCRPDLVTLPAEQARAIGAVIVDPEARKTSARTYSTR